MVGNAAVSLRSVCRAKLKTLLLRGNFRNKMKCMSPPKLGEQLTISWNNIEIKDIYL